MLNQQAFESAHRQEWKDLEAMLDALESARFWKRRQLNTTQLPALYAALCQHHAMAVSRGYSHVLTDRLQGLIQRGHQQLYRYKGNWIQLSLQFLSAGFPAAVRREWRIVALTAGLFFIPLGLLMIICAFFPNVTDLVLGSSTRQMMEQMYDPDGVPFRPEGHEDDSAFFMFAYYILNNVGIGFRMFATGLLFGIGAVFITVYNGIVIGAVAGHLTGIGYGQTFWSFVPGHSAPELLGIVLCGAGGLMLGRALVQPGNRTRRIALLEEARAALPIVLGASLMIAFAAIIEAYWSPRDLPLIIKVVTGLIIWALFIGYFCFVGRKRMTPR